MSLLSPQSLGKSADLLRSIRLILTEAGYGMRMYHAGDIIYLFSRDVYSPGQIMKNKDQLFRAC